MTDRIEERAKWWAWFFRDGEGYQLEKSEGKALGEILSGLLSKVEELENEVAQLKDHRDSYVEHIRKVAEENKENRREIRRLRNVIAKRWEMVNDLHSKLDERDHRIIELEYEVGERT